MTPLVSIIIPCYNEERHIEECVISIHNNDYPSKQIIIIDGGSTDGTIVILRKLMQEIPNLIVLNNPLRITPVSLNLGIANASGEYIMVAGSHTSFSINYISGIMHCFMSEKESVVLIGGTIQTVAKTQTAKSIAIVKVLSNRWGVGNSLFRIGTNEPNYVDTVPFGIYKHGLFKELGGYNEHLIRNHDIELNKRIIRAGKKILLVPSITCIYFARENYRELWKNNFSNGIWNIKTLMITRDFSSLSNRHYIPLFFICSILMPLLASIFTQINWLMLISISTVLVYLMIIFVQSVKIKDKTTNILNLMLGFITLHISYGLGSLIGIANFGILFKKNNE